MTHGERTDLSGSKMLEATESLILEVGTQKTTLKEVGERAGYSRGLANSRFGNKETLFLKLAERCFDVWLQEIQKNSQNKTGLPAFLSRLDAVASFAKHHPETARVMYILWFESVGSTSEMKDRLAVFHQRARKDIIRLIEEAKSAEEISDQVDAKLFAINCTSTLFGLCYQYVVDPEAIDVSAIVQGLKQQMLLILKGNDCS